MIDAFLWYTGLAAWVLIALGCLSLLAAALHDRSVQNRGHDILN
jgi:hypothetical protein